MRFLIDTNVLLWWLENSKVLSHEIKDIISDPENAVFTSAASIWEIRIKESIGKIKLPSDFAAVVEKEDFEMLSVNAQHAHAIAKLPLIHKDPFDRMLIAQANVEALTIITGDAVMQEYGVKCLLI